MASKSVITAYMDPEEKRELDVIVRMLGWTLSDYIVAAVRIQATHDREAFPKAYAKMMAAQEAQEEVREQRGA